MSGRTQRIKPETISLEADFAAARFIRSKLPNGGRIHVDRPLPFICLHLLRDKPRALAAEELCTAQAAHVLAGSASDAMVASEFANLMANEFGACLIVEVYELEEDRTFAEDSTELPPFDVVVDHNSAPGAPEACDAFRSRMAKGDIRYRTPNVLSEGRDSAQASIMPASSPGIGVLRIGVAPIYRQASSTTVYPELLQQLVAQLYDAVLKGIRAFASATTSIKATSHRSFGRKTIVDSVHRVDRQVDAVSSSFDFLLQLTPINTEAAWHNFRRSRYAAAPDFHYRPLPFDIQAKKKELFSISFDQLEDPTLTELFDEKRRELDIQLTMLAERGTPRAKDASRVMYGSVEQSLSDQADEIIDALNGMGEEDTPPALKSALNAFALRDRADALLDQYRTEFSGFEPSVQIRDDIPAGLMVSGPRLLISRTTTIPEQRVEAILSHEIGVHLVTYFNGNEQGLRLLRSGLAGYEGMQEGLAVFSEYAVGGLTRLRLRLLAARVIACQAMLDGAQFVETYRLLCDRCGLSGRGAFHAAMRVHRSGGLAKDAIYLRGLLQVLRHLGSGGSLDVFWVGKIARTHFNIMRELLDRGLLKSIPIIPHFVSQAASAGRIKAASKGMGPLDLLT